MTTPWGLGTSVVAGDVADPDVVSLGGPDARLYYTDNGEILSMITTNGGQTWAPEAGVRLSGSSLGLGSLALVAAADVIHLANGSSEAFFLSLGAVYSASSSDGLNWTLNGGPLLTIGGENPSISSLRGVSVAQLANGSFIMVYEGDSQGAYDSYDPSGSTAMLYWATSSNGVTWTKQGIAVDSRNSELNGTAAHGRLVTDSNGQVELYFYSSGSAPNEQNGIFNVAFTGSGFSTNVTADLVPPPQIVGTQNLAALPADPSLALINGTWQLFYDIGPSGQGNVAQGIYQATANFPVVSAISAVTDTNTNYASPGHVVTVTMSTNETVTVTGTPTLQLNDNEVATYSSGSGSNTLNFAYTVQASDNTSDLQVTGLNLPSGAAIADQAGDELAGSATGNLAIQIYGQQTLVAPLPNATIQGGGFDILNLSQNPIATASSAYTETSNGNGTFNLTTTGSTDVVSGVMQVQFSDKTVTVAANGSENEFIALLYQGALGRTPDAAGLAGWEQIGAALPSTATQSLGLAYALSDTSGGYNGSLSLAAGFTQSAEFIAKYGALTPTQFVTQLYANILDRAPDPAGLAGWLAQLSAGASQAHVLVGFADSAEAINNATLGYTGQSGTHPSWLFLT